MKISVARLSQCPLVALLVVGSALIASEAGADGKLVPATVCQPLVQVNTNPLATLPYSQTQPTRSNASPTFATASMVAC